MTTPADEAVTPRARALFDERLAAHHRDTDRLFAVLLLLQWIAGIVAALVISPLTWAGSASSVHIHVYLALLLGGALSLIPVYMALRHPGKALTRHVVAVGQTLWSALLIHLTGGRIETHFHIFGSLAFLAFYRDFRVVVTATVVVAADHLLRGLFVPQSVYGVLAPGGWRWLEHAGWVVFEDVVLFFSCRTGLREMFETSLAQAKAERLAESAEQQVVHRTRELRRANDELETASKFMIGVFQAVPGALLIFDKDERIKSINEGAQQLLEYEPSELIGEPVAMLFEAPGAPTYAEIERECATSETRTERVCRSKSGASIPVLFSARLLRSVDGRSADAVCVGIDIRDRKRLEVQLRQNQKLESLGQLAAGIAHEINTPTQFVSDNVRFLQSSFGELLPLLETCARTAEAQAPGAELEAVLERVVSAVKAVDLDFMHGEIPRAIEDSLGGLERISGIVRAMKEFSHPGAKTKELFDLNRGIESTIEVARNEWKYVAEVETDLPADLPRVPGFPQDVNQVLLNMIVNAAHAIDEKRKKSGSAEIGRIRIATRALADALEIRIGDTGCGIPEAIRGRIFDPFFTTKEVGKGTGQGLAIAHHVVIEKHGGQIDVESEVGVGTTFVIRLPLSAPATRAAA